MTTAPSLPQAEANPSGDGPEARLDTPQKDLAEVSRREGLDRSIQAALDKVEMLTDSCVGFFHFVERDQENLRLQYWSTRTLDHMCKAEGRGRHYPISEAGVWVDCLRTLGPVVHNDYASLPHRKGLPPGHAPIVRELTVPVIRDGRAVAILGVGNKPVDYTPHDVQLVQHFAEVVVDYTARELTEEALRQANEKLQRDQDAMLNVLEDHTRAEAERTRLVAAIEQAAETIVMTDAEANIVYVNPAFERSSGYTRQEVMGRNPRMLQSGKHDPAFYRQMWDTLAGGNAWRGHLFSKTKGGKLYEENATISPVRDANGRIVNYIAVKQDITHEAELELQLRQAQKVEAIGQLAGGVAHDFNNLLHIILGYSELLLSRPDLPPPLRPQIEDIHKAGTRASDLTRQLLAFSRKQIVQPKVFDLGEAISNMVKMLRRLIGEHIDLHLVVPTRACFTKADPGQIEQVVMNLCLNARDAMPQGGKLTLETTLLPTDGKWIGDHPHLPPGEYVVLAISDTGIGMSAHVKEHLFEPFFTTKDAGKGTGLGLATCYGIVKQNGGEIGVYSEPGLGTTFRVYLKSAGTEQHSSEAPEPPLSAYRGKGETILLVEDEKALRELTSLALGELDYRVLAAGSGAEALQRVASGDSPPIDLLLTDVVMPGMSGPQLAAALRASQPELKVLFVSGYPDEAIARHGVLAPGVALLTKPIASRTLARRVREVLDGPR